MSIESSPFLPQSNSSLSTNAARYDFAAPSPLAQASMLPTSATVRPQANGNPSNSLWSAAEPAAAATSAIVRFQQQIQTVLSDQVTPLRLAGHLSVLIVAATILVMNRIDIPDWNIGLTSIASSAAAETTAERSTAAVHTTANTSALTVDSLQRAAVPFTIIPERGRVEVEIYAVKAGDTVLGIAEKFDLAPETIQWSNASLEANPDLLRIGDKLRILPFDGLIHTVVPGDTLSSLANKYKTSVDDIVAYSVNNLPDAAAPLTLGSEIVVPGGTKPYVPRQVASYSGPAPTSAVKGSGVFTWPVGGSISQRYWSGHPAIDVGSWNGSPVKASDSGYIVAAGGGWNGGYGNHVLIDHGNGFTTLYAHLNSIFVRQGENVSRGQQIGTVGNTGNSTGPHLHFEIRYQGVPQNPFGYLP